MTPTIAPERYRLIGHVLSANLNSMGRPIKLFGCRDCGASIAEGNTTKTGKPRSETYYRRRHDRFHERIAP